MGNESIKKKTQKLFIEPLEQRIMLDGAGASTFLDLIDERNQQQIKINSSNKDIYKEGDNFNKDIPFTNITRDKIRNDKKNIVFIDSAVEDYETITSSFKENTEFYLINANEDGFKRISEILSDRENIDALHLIGHGSAGQILFGNAFLNNETIDNYQATLASIGQSLTTSGDILFYGCNVASTEQGEILIKKISEITKADIAASDDLTGKDGDWELEKQFGLIGEEELQAKNYNHALGSLSTSGVLSGSGVTHIDNNVTMMNSGNVGLGSSGAYATVGSDFGLAVEKQNVSVSSGDLISNVDVDSTYILDDDSNVINAELQNGANQNASSNITVNSYLMFLVQNTNKRASGSAGEVVFDGEIVGIFYDQAKTRAASVDGNTYHSTSLIYAMGGSGGSSNSSDTDGARMPEGKKTHSGMTNFFNSTRSHGSGASIADSSDGSDWVSVSNYGSGTNNRLQFGAQNANPNSGDYIRVLVIPTTNNDPVARNDVGHVAEDGTLQVDNGDNANVSGSYDAAGEHSGDVLQTSSGTHQDTDADSDTLVVASVRTGGTEGSGTSGTLGQALTGSYGQLTLNSNGSYTYVANQSAADALDVGDTVTDVFNYTVSDGNGGTDIATITITIHGANDAPVAADNTATVNEDDTITVTDGETAQTQTYEVNNTIDSSTSLTVGSGTHGSGISFSHDGKKMFKTDYEIDQIHQWTLSTAFDPTSKSGSPTSASLDFDVSDSQRGDWPVGHAWNSDGTKLFVVNWDGVDEYWIHSYDLSTAYDVSTISLVSPSASNSYNTNLYNVKSLAVSSDGTKFYFVEDDAQEIRQITFATAYDVSSSSSSATLSISDTTFPVSLAFSDNGKKLFVGDANNEKIHQYNLTTAWDISSGVSYDGGITLTTTIDPYGIVFTDGGTKMLILDEAGETVDVHSLKSPFNLIDIDDEHDGDVLLDDTDANGGDTLTVTGIRVGSTEGAGTAGSVGSALAGTYGELTIASDGSYSYVANQTVTDALDAGDIVTDTFNYTVSDGNGGTDIAVLTVTVIGVNDAPVADNETGSVAVGNTLTVTDGSSDLLFGDTDADASASLSVSSIVATTASGTATAVNPGTAYNSGYTSVTGSKGTLRIGADGTYQYIAGSSAGTDVFTYTLFDGTATDTATLTITLSNTDPIGRNDVGTVNEDGTLQVDNGDNTTSVTEATYDSSPKDISNEETGPRELAFSNDGKKFFVVGYQGKDINEYHMTTAFDVSTASYDSSFSVNDQETSPHGLAFNSDGTKMFVSGYAGQDVNEYTLNTAWDVSTANFVDSFSVSSQDTEPRGLTFSNDGTKMFITGNTGDTLEEYTLSTGYDVSTASHTTSLDISSFDNDPRGIAFNSDGTRMFFNGQENDQIHEFTLETAFDISTATYVSATSLASFDTGAEAIVFNNDGSKLFVLGNDGNDVSEYALASPFNLDNVSGEHSGDVIDSTNTDTSDTDADGHSLTISAIRTGSVEGSGTTGSIGSALTGTYGQLTIAADGSYSYVANQTVTDALDAGDVVYDSFNYTVSDGNGGTDISILTIRVIGINDAPTAVADTDSVDAGSTVTDTTNSAGTLISDDTDADASSSLYLSLIHI